MCKKERDGCFALINATVSNLYLPRGAVGWSVIVVFPGHTPFLSPFFNSTPSIIIIFLDIAVIK